MSRSTLTLALRIAQLIEAHSEKEIRAAVSLLEKHGVGSELLSFVARRRDSFVPKVKPSAMDARLSQGNTASRAMLQFRESEPEKFHVLSEFDRMIRRGQVLTAPEDLKRFGQQVSKDFRPKKSRKETIGPLMATLAERPLPELRKLIEFAASFGVAGGTDEYQRLAQFLIKGKNQ
jgi:hypothetical protein